jgi:hypothetical protein
MLSVVPLPTAWMLSFLAYMFGLVPGHYDWVAAWQNTVTPAFFMIGQESPSFYPDTASTAPIKVAMTLDKQRIDGISIHYVQNFACQTI